MIVCSKGCDKLLIDAEEITRIMLKFKRCPDCGNNGIMSSNSYRGKRPDNVLVTCNKCHSRLWINIPLKYVDRSVIKKDPYSSYVRDPINFKIGDIIDFIKEENNEAPL
jgi:ribosomal protein S27AE